MHCSNPPPSLRHAIIPVPQIALTFRRPCGIRSSAIADTLFFLIRIDPNFQIVCCLRTESIIARLASQHLAENDGILRTDEEVVELLQSGRHPGQRVGPTAFGTGTKWSQSRIRPGSVAGTDAIARAHAIASICFTLPQRDEPRVA
jgi:hypothetical protein